MNCYETLLKEMYNAQGIQLITEQTWRKLNISVNLKQQLKKALHSYQKKTKQAEVIRGMSMKAYGYMNEMKALQALKAIKHVN